MAKGGKRTGAGRPKGVGNKSTELAREAVARFLDDNTERLQGWLDEIAEDNPKDAFNCVKDLMEYHIPKLARQDAVVENKYPNGHPFDHLKFEVVKPKDE